MPFCDECGSTSQDTEGFCRGCGARLRIAAPGAPQEKRIAHARSDPLPRPATSLPPVDLFPSMSKSVWMAIFRTALLGPIGMLYSTVTGALVMSAVSAVVLIFAGGRWMWISWAACIVWAAVAARD
jgi:hypothetical protein